MDCGFELNKAYPTLIGDRVEARTVHLSGRVYYVTIGQDGHLTGGFWTSIDRFKQMITLSLAQQEQQRALTRAKELWGDTAWVLNQSDLSGKMFIVSAGKHPSIRAYGEGESWDEAFVSAGESLFAPRVIQPERRVQCVTSFT